MRQRSVRPLTLFVIALLIAPLLIAPLLIASTQLRAQDSFLINRAGEIDRVAIALIG